MLSHKASAICSLHHLPLSIAPRAPVAAASASVRRQAPFICQARSGRFGSQHPEADDEVGGDKNVQDTLADLLQIEVIRQQVKQDIMDDLEIRKDSLRQIGQEVGICAADSMKSGWQ